MSRLAASIQVTPRVVGRLTNVAALVLAGTGLALLLAIALRTGPAPAPRITTIGGLAAIGVLALAVGRYEAAAGLGVFLLGVVFVEPSPPDAVLGIVMLVAVLTGRFTVRAVPLSMLIGVVALLALNAISAIFALYPGRAVFFFAITAYVTLLALWLTGYVNSVERARSIVRPLVAGAVVSAVVGVAVLFVGFPGKALVDFSDGFRARGFFKDPNVYGPFLVVVALIVLAEILEPRLLKGKLVTKLAMLLALSLGVLFAYSRAAWLNAAVGLLTMLGVYTLRRRGGANVAKIVITLVIAFIIGIGSLAATGQAQFLQERAHLQSYDTERFSAQEEGLALAQRYPLGIGPGQFEYTTPIASHSTYVRTLAEQGVLGLVVMVVLLFGTLGFAMANVIRGSDTYGISSAALLAAWCGVVANSAFVDTLHWRHLWFVAALIWAGAMRRVDWSRSAFP